MAYQLDYFILRRQNDGSSPVGLDFGAELTCASRCLDEKKMRGDCLAITCVLNMCYGMGVSVVAKERYSNDPLLAYRKHVMCYRMEVSMVVKERYCNDHLLAFCKHVPG